MTRLHRTSLPPSLALLAACDFLLLAACFALAASWTQASGVALYLFYQDGLLQILPTAALIQITLYWERMYERIAPFSLIFRQMLLALGVAFLLQALLAYTHSLAAMPRWTMISGSMVALFSFPVWRVAAAAMLRKSLPARKILLLTAYPPDAEVWLRLRDQPEAGLAAIGYLGPKTEAPPLPHLGSLRDLDQVIERYAPHRIVIGRNTANAPVRRLLELQKSGAEVEQVSSLYEGVTGRISLLELPPARLIFSAGLDPRPGYLVARDIYSVFIGLLLLIAAAPLFALAAIAARRSSPGPVFEREPRVGWKGAPIALYRFRNREALKWLHKLKLAELPLLFNVVRGELAMCGPAPERPEFAAALREKIPLYNHRLSVKPGLTGWAQIHRGPDADMPDTLASLEYDFYYIKHLSPRLDAYIAILSLRPQAGPA